MAKVVLRICITSSTASLAANAIISAQETVPGQNNSKTLLADSMTENPPSDVLAGSFCSVPFPRISTDASQPYYHIIGIGQIYFEI